MNKNSNTIISSMINAFSLLFANPPSLIPYIVLDATIIDENPCDARKNPIPNVIKNVGDIFVAVSIGVNKSANSPPRTFDNNVDTKSFDIFKYELV